MDVPIRFLPTQTIAPETFLIRQLAGEGIAPLAAPINTVVVRGAEPVIVDTGVRLTSEGWLDRAFELVDPADVRWIYLSHDDTDHTGSLFEVLERAPQATLVTNWFTVERMSGDALLPLHRIRIVNPGESFTAGDRTFTALVPPVFDSPTTRGLYDSATGVYWAADAFAATTPGQVDDMAEFDPGLFRESFLHTQRMISPWHEWLDPGRYRAHLDVIRGFDPTVVVGCHGVALRGEHVDTAFELLAQLPDLPPAPLMGQPELDGLLAMLAGPAGPSEAAA